MDISDFSHYFGAINELRSGLSSKSNILLNGHSGSGKTTLIHLLVKEYKFEVLHVHSSNYESLSSCKNMFHCFASTTSIKHLLYKFSKLILIDDLDVIMNIDKNFCSFLVDFTNASKCIIVCINNHTINKKINDIKTIFDYVVTLKKLTYKQCFQIIMQKYDTKGDIDYEKLSDLIKNSNNDLRTVLTYLNDTRQDSKCLGTPIRCRFTEMSINDIIYEMCSFKLTHNDIYDIIGHDTNTIVSLIHENITHWLSNQKHDKKTLFFLRDLNNIFIESEYLNKSIFEKYDFSIWDLYTFSRIKSLNHLLVDYGIMFKKTEKMHYSQMINKQSLAFNFNKKLIKMEHTLDINKMECSYLFLYLYTLMKVAEKNNEIAQKVNICRIITKNEFEIITRFLSDFYPSEKNKMIKLKLSIIKNN